MSKKKQSLILGALIGSAGIFLTKFIGMIYVIPFNALVGEGNMAFYSYAYRTYTYILNVSSAGFPFAIAALVAKYMVKDDYDTVLAIRRISFYIMSLFGMIGMFGLILMSTPLAQIVSPIDASIEYLNIVKTCYCIISLALFFVPVLSVYRGFYQGLKELTLYAQSQVVEQVVRVVFLLVAGFISVYVFKSNRIMAVYFAVLSTSIAAVVAIIQFVFRDRVVFKDLKEKANRKVTKDEYKRILNEMLQYALPYMIVSILGYSYFIIDMLVFNRTMGLRGEINADLIYGIINMNVDKLTSIPMAVAPGFSVAVVPYISASYEEKNYPQASRYVNEAIITSLYLALPLTLVLASLSKPLYYIFYGATYTELDGEILRWYSLDGLASTISPVITSITMALGLRKQNMKNVAIGIFIKLVSVVPLIYLLGYPGACLSSVIGTLSGCLLNFLDVNRRVEVPKRDFINSLSKIVLCLLFTQIVFVLGQKLGLVIVNQGRVIGLIQFIVLGGFGAVTYLISSFYFKLPQYILHKSTDELLTMIRLKRS
ncbi:MAG: oligosaccharide flippase family protein [Erysipelotrichales bacterium]|nr:oligosaccharide flippase family protein [Erysipelotrichales bacterium]